MDFFVGLSLTTVLTCVHRNASVLIAIDDLYHTSNDEWTTPSPFVSSSKLVINQIIPEDDAIYQCMAENDQGSILSMARLIVVMSEDRPSTPRNVRPETVSSSAILLAWDRPLYNSDKVIAYSVHYMKAEGMVWGIWSFSLRCITAIVKAGSGFALFIYFFVWGLVSYYCLIR